MGRNNHSNPWRRVMTTNATTPQLPEPDPERRHPAPTLQPYRQPVPLNKDRLDGAPRYPENDVPPYTSEYGRSVDGNYGSYL